MVERAHVTDRTDKTDDKDKRAERVCMIKHPCKASDRILHQLDQAESCGSIVPFVGPLCTPNKKDFEWKKL